jgi:hypothetical protein
MSSINQLSEAVAATGSMQIPVYDPNNGQPRKISLNQLTEYVQDNLASDTPTPFRLFSGTVTDLNTNYPAASWAGAVAYCTNGNTGVACLAVSDGIAWKRIPLGATISP